MFKSFQYLIYGLGFTVFIVVFLTVKEIPISKEFLLYQEQAKLELARLEKKNSENKYRLIEVLTQMIYDKDLNEKPYGYYSYRSVSVRNIEYHSQNMSKEDAKLLKKYSEYVSEISKLSHEIKEVIKNYTYLSKLNQNKIKDQLFKILAHSGDKKTTIKITQLESDMIDIYYEHKMKQTKDKNSSEIVKLKQESLYELEKVPSKVSKLAKSFL